MVLFSRGPFLARRKRPGAVGIVVDETASGLPQLGDSVEVIETSTPQTVYETTRRRLGMIGAPSAIESAGTAGTAVP